MKNKVSYREIQKPRQVWAWVLVLLIAVFFWYAFIQQIIFGVPLGTKPASNVSLVIFWFIFGVVFPGVMIRFLRLVIEARTDGIYIRFMPFHLHYRKFLYRDIEECQPIVYSVSDFGGWGIRTNLEGETAYTMSGKQGVKLKLKHQTVLIGTQKPNKFLEAIDSLKENA